MIPALGAPGQGRGIGRPGPRGRHLGEGLNVLCSCVSFCESDQVFSIKGRRALVTGGGSGIGKAMAAALAEAGAQVVLAGRSEQRLLEAAKVTGASAWVATDLSAEHGCTTVCDKAGDIDILVNAAGLNLRPPLEELRLQDWDRTIATNLTAPFLLGQRLGPEMAQRGWGRIINIGSQQSWRAFGNSGAYGVSKAGMLGLTRSQAEAWSPSGVTANCIIPGFVRTPMTESASRKTPFEPKSSLRGPWLGETERSRTSAESQCSLHLMLHPSSRARQSPSMEDSAPPDVSEPIAGSRWTRAGATECSVLFAAGDAALRTCGPPPSRAASLTERSLSMGSAPKADCVAGHRPGV